MAKKKSKVVSGDTQILGLDIGYGVIKALLDDNDPLTFPSVAGHARDIKFQSDELSEKYPGDRLTDDEGDWFIGALALSQLPVGEVYTLRGRTAQEVGNAFRVRMTKAALGKLFSGVTNGDVIHLAVATGLPVDHMGDAVLLKESLIGQHPIQTDTANIVANIVDVAVMPQPYGTIYFNMLTPEGDVNEYHIYDTTGVLDVGTYTIDATVSHNLEYIQSQSGSVESGVHVAQRHISEAIENQFREKPSLPVIEGVLRTGMFKAHGQVVSFVEEREEALRPVRDATMTLINSLWKIGFSLDFIALVGGGAELVYDVVKTAYPQTRLMQDPQIANARGYLRYMRNRMETQKA